MVIMDGKVQILYDTIRVEEKSGKYVDLLTVRGSISVESEAAHYESWSFAKCPDYSPKVQEAVRIELSRASCQVKQRDP